MRARGECMKKSSRFRGLVLMLLGATLFLTNLGEPRIAALPAPMRPSLSFRARRRVRVPLLQPTAAERGA